MSSDYTDSELELFRKTVSKIKQQFVDVFIQRRYRQGALWRDWTRTTNDINVNSWLKYSNTLSAVTLKGLKKRQWQWLFQQTISKTSVHNCCHLSSFMDFTRKSMFSHSLQSLGTSKWVICDEEEKLFHCILPDLYWVEVVLQTDRNAVISNMLNIHSSFMVFSHLLFLPCL